MQNRSGRKLAASLFAAVVLAGVGSIAQAESTGKWRDGQEVYDKVCGYCHETGVGPALKGRDLAVDYVRHMVRYGNRAMPSFRPTEIDDEMLLQVARLISGKRVP